MSARRSVLVPLAFLAGCISTYLAVRLFTPARELPQAESQELPLPKHTASAGFLDSPVESEVPSRVPVPPPQAASVPQPKQAQDAPMPTAVKGGVGSDAFPNATQLMADPEFNPGRKPLTTEQRHELQALVNEANAKEREFQKTISAQVEAHSHWLVEQGLAQPVARGVKWHASAPEHDVCSLIGDSSGSYGVSFTKHSVPEIAASMDARDELVRTTTTAIQQYFASH